MDQNIAEQMVVDAQAAAQTVNTAQVMITDLCDGAIENTSGIRAAVRSAQHRLNKLVEAIDADKAAVLADATALAEQAATNALADPSGRTTMASGIAPIGYRPGNRVKLSGFDPDQAGTIYRTSTFDGAVFVEVILDAGPRITFSAAEVQPIPKAEVSA